MNSVFLPMLLLIISPFTTSEDIIKPGETLNLRKCIEIALRMHPDVSAARGTVNVNESKVKQAEANYYPQIDLSSVYRKYSSDSGNTSNPMNEYSVGAALKQNIFNFGKTTTQVNIQKFNLDSSISDLENVRNQIIFNVTDAYYGLLGAKKNRDVAVEVARQFEQHLEQAMGFYDVGTKPKFDVTKAEVDLSNARLNLIRSENALKIAMANLNGSLGIPHAPAYEIEDTLSFSPYKITFEDAIKQASENRPDLRSLILRKKAAESTIEFSKKDYYPTLSGNAEYNWSGEKLPLDDNWTVGATVTFPLFSGFSTKYQVEEAKANLMTLNANEESLRQAIFLEVKKSFLNLQEAEERIFTAEITIRHAGENLDLAKGRYAAGVGNPIEVTDALVVYSNARISYIQALYDHKGAKANLEKAMGLLKVKNQE